MFGPTTDPGHLPVAEARSGGDWDAQAEELSFRLHGVDAECPPKPKSGNLLRSSWEQQKIADAGQRPLRKYYKLMRSGKARPFRLPGPRYRVLFPNS